MHNIRDLCLNHDQDVAPRWDLEVLLGPRNARLVARSPHDRQNRGRISRNLCHGYC